MKPSSNLRQFEWHAEFERRSALPCTSSTSVVLVVASALATSRAIVRGRSHPRRLCTMQCGTTQDADIVSKSMDLSEVERLLHAGLYDAGLRAAVAAEEGSSTARAQFFRAVALVGMQQYEDALSLIADVDVNAAGVDIGEFREIVERLRHQSEDGIFPFTDVYGDAIKARDIGDDLARSTSATAALLPRFADFIGPVEVAITTKGRGLFAKQDIKAGDLIFCASPLVMAPDVFRPGSIDPLVPELRRACSASPHSQRIVLELLSNGKSDPATVVITEFSWKSAGAASQHSSIGITDEYLDGVAQTNSFEDFGYTVLYPTIAMANHSCCPNATVVGVGHTTFVRANQAIKQGAEVCIPYFDVLRPVAERERLTVNWGFRCECPRCKVERTFPIEVQSLGVAVEQVENIIKDPESSIDLTGREVQWMRSSHILAYRGDLEQVFPMSEEALWQRERILRAIETTDPASFTHVKFAWLDWYAKSVKPGPGHKETQQAVCYCALVHQARYGGIPGDQMIPLLKCTQAAFQTTGVGKEFCNSTSACPPGANTSTTSPLKEEARGSNQATPGRGAVTMLD